MTPRRSVRSVLLVSFLVVASLALAQTAPPVSTPKHPPTTPAVAPPPAIPAVAATAPAPAPPPSPVSGIRSKLSAGDLLSAESILEVHRETHGEDRGYLSGMGWLARGALLVGDTAKARRYAADVRARCADSLAHGVRLEENHGVEIALGAAIEVEAQLLERSRGPAAAAAHVKQELARIAGPVALRSRLNKRINLLALAGASAPAVEAEDHLGDAPPSWGALRGKPKVLFLWAEWCGDCKAQAASLARVRSRYASQGVQVLAVTRFYDDDSLHVREKARVDSVWKAVYPGLADVPVVFSREAMERYGGSSTPTFVFVDRSGVVRWYTPTRLTESELDRAMATIVH
jgi:thiol-disulfide isomerase/thioredoxin